MLPLSRTTPAPPFERTGMDFAGPFYIRQGKVCKPTRVKCYACLFICLTTKAVHIELCADLTTGGIYGCISSLHSSERYSSTPFSDNGTNFVGAHNEIKQIKKLLSSPSTAKAISHEATRTSLQWHFSPPRAPHHGGLWEAGVKSMKTQTQEAHVILFTYLQ